MATFIYPNKDKPQYHKGHTVVLGLLVGAWFLQVAPALIRIETVLTDGYRVALNVLYCHKINKDKAKGKYDQYVGYADDRDPDFMMVL